MGSVQISRTEMTSAELRAAAAKLSDAAAARRALSIALVLEGADRESAARFGGMDRQTLRDWVHRYNAHGLAVSNTPYANLFYVKPALDLLFLNSIKEGIAPGYMRRQEKRRRKDYGQGTVVLPADRQLLN